MMLPLICTESLKVSSIYIVVPLMVTRAPLLSHQASDVTVQEKISWRTFWVIEFFFKHEMGWG